MHFIILTTGWGQIFYETPSRQPMDSGTSLPMFNRQEQQANTNYRIFELQERTISSLIMIFLMGLLMFFITPIYFWRSPGHLFFTYIIPIIPIVLVFDGYVSSLRTRSPEEVYALMKSCGASCDGWTIKSGQEQHTFPIGYLTWFIATKN